jgi:hypothetical protein
MADWLDALPYDPMRPLLASVSRPIQHFAGRDLLGKTTSAVQTLWELPEAQRIVRKQQLDGAWRYPGGNHAIRSETNYNQLETFRNLGYLIELYSFDRSSPVIRKAADFILSCQTDAGDIRGILGNQYTPYYTAGFLELLIKAGYVDDPRVERAFTWLRGMRQNDGGWAIPLRTRHRKLDVIASDVEALEPDRTQPFSHLVTGVVLRAYAAHPVYRQATEARVAGQLLLSRFFQRDPYPDRASPDFWLRFTFPFWFTDLISAMDSLVKVGFEMDEPNIQAALQWFEINQQQTGLWKVKTLKNQHRFDTDEWTTLAICRIFKHLYADKGTLQSPIR